MPSPAWTTEVDARLFSAIIEVCDLKISGSQWRNVSEVMDMGFSGEALRQRFMKLRKAASVTSATSNDGLVTTPKSEKSTARATPRKKKDGKSPRRKRGAQRTSGNDSVDSGDELLESPTKKSKKGDRISGDDGSFFAQDEDST